MISTILMALWVILKVIGYYFLALWHTIVSRRPKDIRGKLVLVTGGRRGIGRALGLEFAKHGANIVLWDIDKEETEQAAEDIRSSTGVKAKAYVCDVADASQVKATAAQVKRDMGKVDILVNNAAISCNGDILGQSEEGIIRTLNVNLLSHFWTLRQFLPDMIESGEGHILAVASLVSFMGAPSITTYCTTKFGIRGLCESIERELKVNYNCTGIKVSVVFPGSVDTHLLRLFLEELKYEWREEEVISPENVAELTVDGVLRNQRLIFIPSYLSAIQYIKTLLPHKAFEFIQDLL